MNEGAAVAVACARLRHVAAKVSSAVLPPLRSTHGSAPKNLRAQEQAWNHSSNEAAVTVSTPSAVDLRFRRERLLELLSGNVDDFDS